MKFITDLLESYHLLCVPYKHTTSVLYNASNEITETKTKKAYADNALKLSTGNGVHHEWEVDIGEDDMMRFGSYHMDLSRIHKISFTTVIITAKEPRCTSYVSPSMNFTPKIINLKDRDADKALAEIDRKLKAGKHEEINELEIIYLPLYNSVSDNELNKIMEANMRILEDTTAFRVLEARGRSQEKESIAINMIRDGDDYTKIARNTGLSMERLEELAKEEFLVHA